jgi:hypothetical protein
MFKLPKLENIGDKINEYLESRIELIKLDIQTSISKSLVRLSLILLKVFALFMVMIFLSLALAGFLNGIFGNLYMGYLVLVLIYFLFFICLQLKSVQNLLFKIVSKITESIISDQKEEKP